MEFPFNVNQLFSEKFSIVDKTLVAGRVSSRRPDLQSHIATVIDELGRASAKAQKLTTPVTSVTKMQSQHHQLYLMKDGESKGGCGAIVGFLKVGYKKLFLLDQRGLHVEAEPLCVLDFFIAENLQRHGCGLELFNFMLQHKNIDPVLMAYDRPSPKLLSFLAKHYRLTQSVPQVNNFVVFDGFFNNKSVAQLRTIPLKKPDGEIKPYSIMEREAVRQERKSLPWPFAAPHSPQRLASSQYSLSVGSSPTRAPPQAAIMSASGVHKDQIPNFPLIERSRERRTSKSHHLATVKLILCQHVALGNLIVVSFGNLEYSIMPTRSSCQRRPVQSSHGHHIFGNAGKNPVRYESSRSPTTHFGTYRNTEVGEYADTTKEVSHMSTNQGQYRLQADIPQQQKTTPKNRC